MLGASLLEAPLTSATVSYLGVGLAEESIKAVVIVAVGWTIRPQRAAQGAALGATVGAGFAAFESAGYAYNAALGHRGLDLLAVLDTEIVRAVLTPAGHVMWSALVGAAFFGAAGSMHRNRPVSLRAIGVLLIASGLHALWDSMSWISSGLAVHLAHHPIPHLGYGQVLRSSQSDSSTRAAMLYVGGLAVVSGIGYLLLMHELKRAHRSLARSEISAG
jgi:RsiW-degrading membrane proteinase PrsW (M82 family)